MHSAMGRCHESLARDIRSICHNSACSPHLEKVICIPVCHFHFSFSASVHARASNPSSNTFDATWCSKPRRMNISALAISQRLTNRHVSPAFDSSNHITRVFSAATSSEIRGITGEVTLHVFDGMARVGYALFGSYAMRSDKNHPTILVSNWITSWSRIPYLRKQSAIWTVYIEPLMFQDQLHCHDHYCHSQHLFHILSRLHQSKLTAIMYTGPTLHKYSFENDMAPSNAISNHRGLPVPVHMMDLDLVSAPVCCRPSNVCCCWFH